MENINGKKFWITYATLNVALLLIFASLSPFDYSFLLGFFVGEVSFLFFLGSLYLSLKLIDKKHDTETKNIRSSKAILILIFFVLLLSNTFLLSLFIWLNSYYNNLFNLKKTIAFFPFNVITMTSPYLLLSVHIILWAIIVALTKFKKRRKEKNG